MKIVSVKKNNKKNRGFTLVELLVVIAILAIISTIVIYSVINIMNNSKESSYKVTVNNVENQASSYVLENLSLSKWQYGSISDTSYQYQCVSVQDLMDAGYFKSDVLESYVSKDRMLLATDDIYIERDTERKTITKNVLILDSKYNGLCDDFNVTGKISFNIEPSGWSVEKRITINYNIYNVDNVSNYKYSYSFGKTGDSGQFKKTTHQEVITVTKNGVVEASILDKDDNVIVSDDLLVGNIDNEGPKIVFGTNGNNIWSKSASSTITVIDSESGVDANSLQYIYSTSNSAKPSMSFANGENVTYSLGNGIYYLIAKACDNFGNCTTKVSNAFKLDNISPIITLGTNGNSTWAKSASSTITATDSNSGIDTNSLKYIFSTSNTATPSISFTNRGRVMMNLGNGTYYLVAKACDVAGNCTTKVSNVFKLDNTGPTITLGTNGNSTWVKSASSRITATDRASGIDTNSLKYIFSTSNTAIPSTSFTNGGSVTKDSVTGKYYLVVKACDILGNCNTKVSNIFKLDNSGPTITLGTDGNSSWSKSASSRITVADNNSGVKSDSLKYIFSTSNTATPNTSFMNGVSVTKDLVTGEYYLVAKACDVAGNCTTKASKVFKLDNTNPVITLGTDGNGSWSKSASSTITVADSNSGVKNDSLKYIFSTSNTVTPNTLFTNTSSVTKDSVTGEYYLIARACDVAGNCVLKVSKVFKLDNAAPTFTIAHKTADGSTYSGGWTNQVITSTLTYSDDGSGIDTSKVTSWTNVNTTPVTLTSCSATSCTDTWGTSAGDRDITGYNKVCDKLGNCTTKSYAIKQDMTLPVITCNNSVIWLKQWHNGDGEYVDEVDPSKLDVLNVTPSSSNNCVASVILKKYKGKVYPNYKEIIYARDDFSGLYDNFYDYVIYKSNGVESSTGFVPHTDFYGGRWVWTLTATDRAGNKATGTFTINVTYES